VESLLQSREGRWEKTWIHREEERRGKKRGTGITWIHRGEGRGKGSSEY
jgi:hypothetical protein